MWIDPKTLDVVTLHSDIRKLRPNWSGPGVMTDNMIALLGFEPVVTSVPNYDQVTETVTALPVALVDGVWTQQWQVIPLPDDQVALNKQALQEVFAERAARLKAEQEGANGMA
jgi:hypothetical protein